ncbi:SLAM family member 9-like [Muntiacus reevesi]|uniref:SLAM family member 9-like n=1 Tax=Muntiacus reevesi TaxID=9886 RepID=UPI003307C145
MAMEKHWSLACEEPGHKAEAKWQALEVSQGPVTSAGKKAKQKSHHFWREAGKPLGICSTVAWNSVPRGSEAQDYGFVPMYGIRGDSVLFNVTKKPEADPEEVSWGFGPESNYRVLLQVPQGTDTPTWVNLQDKYQQRVHVPSLMSLRIENLTLDDSGQYQARASFTGGIELTQVFHLTVGESVIHPEILVKSSSITPGWCNVTLECKSPGNTEDLSVTWESKGLPRELEWSGTPEIAPNTWKLTVNKSLIQPSAKFTCVVGNHVEKKTASVDFAQVCSHGSHRQMMADSLGGILWTIVVVLFFPGT